MYRNNELVREITFPDGVEVIEKDGHFVGFQFPERDKESSPIRQTRVNGQESLADVSHSWSFLRDPS